MNLTGKQLVEQGIITQLMGDSVPEENIQQHGVDLNVIRIEQVDGTNDNGIVPVSGKTKLAQRIFIEPRLKQDDLTKPFISYWYLMPGVYDITCAQGCKVPADKMLLIRQRSSMLRNGTILHSSVFDAGFETDQIGTVMIVHTPIEIEVGARVAQIYAHNSNVVEKLYDGQWQGDKQRIEESK